MAHPIMRWLAVLLSSALLVGALAFAAIGGVERTVSRSSAWALLDGSSSQLNAAALAQPAIVWRGGLLTTSTGETVDVRVSDALPAETSTPEGWGEFLTHLTHGSEITQLTTYIGTLEDVQGICGSDALGCYGRDQLVAIGEPAPDGTTPEEVVRHEYGHHIAQHRVNAPWGTIDWGPKRWASVSNVCARVLRKEAFPGDEAVNYALNPGEAWAETYRLLQERKAGIATSSWQIVSQSFYPSEAALQAAEQDVLHPWTAPRTTLSTHVFGKKSAKVWVIPLQTPLDGDVRISATMPKGGTGDVALVSGNRSTVIRRAQWVSQRVKRLDGSVCGQRSLSVRVTQKGALGRVRLSVTVP